MQTIHDAAASGYAANATGYATGRPDYPAALDGWLKHAVQLRAGKVVVDLGAGTGKFVPRLETTGATVIAVEPVAAMRARLVAAHPRVVARDGIAESLPIDDAAVDAVVCAQAFHWFATSAALEEIARVLKPGAMLALIWNVRDESVPWIRRLTDIMSPHEGDAPRYYKGDWRRVFPMAAFGPLHETRFPHVHVGSPEHVIVDRVMSVSFIAALPAPGREAVERQLRALIDSEPALSGRETIAVPYETVAYCCTKIN